MALAEWDSSSDSGISSTHACTTSPRIWRRASRPTDSAMTLIAFWGSMKHSDIATPPWGSDGAKGRTWPGRIVGVWRGAVCRRTLRGTQHDGFGRRSVAGHTDRITGLRG